MNKIKVGILGAGSIGAMKQDQFDSPDTEYPLTHAHAIYKNSNFDLVWIYDNNIAAMEQAIKKWKVSKNRYLDPVDVIVVATPTYTHLKEIEKICSAKKEHRPKVIVLEKPAGQNLYEATRIDYLTKQIGIKVLVNYTRRFVPEIETIAEKVKDQKIQCIVFYYTRGFIRDASHAIDMVNYFAGTFIKGEILDIDPIIDWSKDDPTYGAIMQYSKCPYVYFVPVDGREFDIFEMHIMTDKTRHVFSDHFCRVAHIEKRKEKTYGNYYSMSMPVFHQSINLQIALKQLYYEVYDYFLYLNNPELEQLPFSCETKEAIRVHNIIDRLTIQKQIKENE